MPPLQWHEGHPCPLRLPSRVSWDPGPGSSFKGGGLQSTLRALPHRPPGIIADLKERSRTLRPGWGQFSEVA